MSLRECPFCGKTDIAFKSERIEPRLGEGPASCITKVWVKCNYCGAHGRTATIEAVSVNDITVAATEAWNRRT